MAITPGSMNVVGLLQKQLLEIQIRGQMVISNNATKTFRSSAFYVKPSSAVSGDSKDSMGTAFIAAVWTAKLQAAMSSLVINPSVWLRWVDVPYDQYAQCSTTPGATSGVSTDRLPSDSSVTIQKVSALSGRQNMGRFSLFGVPEADTTKDELVGAAIVRWQAVASALAVAIVGAGGETMSPCIYRKTESLPFNNPPIHAYTTLASGTRASGLAAGTKLNLTIGSAERRSEHPNSYNE